MAGAQDTLVFPNKHAMTIKYWNAPQCRVYLCKYIASAKKHDHISHISIIVAAPDIPLRSLKKMFGTTQGTVKKPEKYHDGKLLCVPHRCQLPGLDGCAFTTFARQLAYLGSSISPILSVTAFWSGGGPHNQQEGDEYGFRMKRISITPKPLASKRCLRFIKLYNAEAEKQNKPIIRVGEGKGKISWRSSMNQCDPDIIKNMDTQTLLEPGYKKFRNIIIHTVDSGYPIGWTVTNHTSKGKHRRLIIGYDLTKDIIYYSEPWSPKHQLKSMPFISAYLITVWCQIVTEA